MFFNPLWLLMALPPLVLGLWAQSRVRSAFNKYSRVRTGRGVTGAQAARYLLDANGLQHVAVERVDGVLSDHYDPRSKTLRLSTKVFAEPNIAAVGVAAHETGHALQDRDSYGPLKVRSAIVPAVQIGSGLGPILFFIGFVMQSTLGDSLAWIGIILFGLAAVFALVTLPVELDASKRAKVQLVTAGIVTTEEVKGVDRVLDAAALTYVAAAVQAVMQLLYYVMIMRRRN